MHLAWADAGARALEQFLSSYTEHSAGAGHRLVIAWNGYGDAGTLQSARALANGVAHDDLVVTRREMDLTVYRQVAEQVSERAICFLNSYSRLLHDGWLGALSENLEQPGVGLVGATGSWESPLSGAPLPLRFLRSGRYPPFPNPHVRTNAFMLRRETMLSLRWPRITTKSGAWELESGNQSVTRQVEGRGQRVLIVGRDGQGYPRERWRESATFRLGEQTNLLVEDNRTRQYADAGPRLRRKLTRLAWGDPVRVSGRSPLPAGAR